MIPATVSGAPAAAYIGTWMRNPHGLNAARVSADAIRAGRSRLALLKLRLAATVTRLAPGPVSRHPARGGSRPPKSRRARTAASSGDPSRSSAAA